VQKAATRQKKHRAQEQKIANGKHPQADEIENSIGRNAEATKLHAERFNPEVGRPFRDGYLILKNMPNNNSLSPIARTPEKLC
jgi:hypothetical protein